MYYVLSECSCDTVVKYEYPYIYIYRLMSLLYSNDILTTQSEIYRRIFDNYGGTSGKVFVNYRGHYVGEV